MKTTKSPVQIVELTTCEKNWQRATFAQLPNAPSIDELMPRFRRLPEFFDAPAASKVNFGRTWLTTNASISPACPGSCFGWILSLRLDAAGAEIWSAIYAGAYLPLALRHLLTPPTAQEFQLASEDRRRFLPELSRLLQMDQSTLQRHTYPV